MLHTGYNVVDITLVRVVERIAHNEIAISQAVNAKNIRISIRYPKSDKKLTTHRQHKSAN